MKLLSSNEYMEIREIFDRRKKLRKILENRGICHAIIADESNIYYFTGYRGQGLYYQSLETERLYVPVMEYWKAIENVRGSVSVYPVSRLPLEYSELPHLISRSFKDIVKNIMKMGKAAGDSKTIQYVNGMGQNREKLVEIENDLRKLRREKSQTELLYLKKATAITEKALEKTLSEIKTGMTEREIYLKLISNIYLFGGEGLGFDPIVAIDANTSNPHAIPGKRRLKSDSILLIDVGAVFHGYTSDMTRTVVSRKSVYDTILDNLIQAYEDALEYYREGVSVREAEIAARRRLALRNLDKYFIHSLGHGVGIDVHEDPGVNAMGENVFRVGDVVTLEPGVYFPYIGGLRIENVVYIEESGPSVINSLPLKIDWAF